MSNLEVTNDVDIFALHCIVIKDSFSGGQNLEVYAKICLRPVWITMNTNTRTKIKVWMQEQTQIYKKD